MVAYEYNKCEGQLFFHVPWAFIIQFPKVGYFDTGFKITCIINKQKHSGIKDLEVMSSLPESGKTNMAVRCIAFTVPVYMHTLYGQMCVKVADPSLNWINYQNTQTAKLIYSMVFVYNKYKTISMFSWGCIFYNTMWWLLSTIWVLSAYRESTITYVIFGLQKIG